MLGGIESSIASPTGSVWEWRILKCPHLDGVIKRSFRSSHFSSPVVSRLLWGSLNQMRHIAAKMSKKIKKKGVRSPEMRKMNQPDHNCGGCPGSQLGKTLWIKQDFSPSG